MLIFDALPDVDSSGRRQLMIVRSEAIRRHVDAYAALSVFFLILHRV